MHVLVRVTEGQQPYTNQKVFEGDKNNASQYKNCSSLQEMQSIFHMIENSHGKIWKDSQ